VWGCVKSNYGWKVVFCGLFFLTLSACFHEKNRPPTANAGADVVASITSTITLNANESSDVDNDRLRYTWEIIEKPEGSNSFLSNSEIVNPQIVLDQIGQYTIQLVVSDGKKQSKPDFVTITSFNDRPIAIISELSVPSGKHYIPGDTISLDASLSSDPENQDMFYLWELTVKPDESNAVLSTNTGMSPSFTVDAAGHYIVHLIVNDGFTLSEPEIIIFEILAPSRKSDNRPFAEAGPDQALFAGNTTIQLDGRESYDLDNDVLSYRWEMIYKPEGSVAALNSANEVTPHFTADVLGDYVIKLVVSDLNGDSHFDTVIISPHDTSSLACGDCHNNIITDGKPQNHLLTYDDCFQCHFIDSWNIAKGNFHAHGHTAQPAQCDICHNGTIATGKTTNHIITDKDCNACHQLIDTYWQPALSTPTVPEFSHKGIYTACNACHDNQLQKGKPAGHMPVSDRCLACHTTSSWESELHLEHTQIFNQCTQCHNGIQAKGKSLIHIATDQNCVQCHQRTTFKSPRLSKPNLSHPEVTEPCAVCHDKTDEFSPAQHLPTSNQCEACHDTVAWKPAIAVDHTEAIGQCNDCHNNSVGRASWRPPLHINASNNCAACHSTDRFIPKLNVDHNEVAGGCVDCHNGLLAIGKPTNHIPTTNNCSACHATTSFVPVLVVSHPDKVGPCVDCHNNSIAGGKVPMHITSSHYCEACHASFSWQLLKTVNHAEIPNEALASCASCHNSIIATGINPTHFPSTDRCELCHSTSSWTEAIGKKITHSEVLGTCESCHVNLTEPSSPMWPVLPSSHGSGEYNNCGDAGCHSTTQWAIMKPIDHSLKTTGCFLCHDGTIATGQSVNHINTTSQCEACHENTFWRPLLLMDHSNTLGECQSCHDGTKAKGRNTNHLPLIDNKCDFCHDTNAFSPIIAFDHSQIDGNCFDCHNGTVLAGQSELHLLTNIECAACHTSFTWVPIANVDHQQLLGDCYSCHNNLEAVGKPANHVASSNECDLCHQKTAPHWWYLKAEVHFNIVAPCTDCHVSPTQHSALDVVDQCESCHIVASWENPARTLVQ